MVVNLVSLRGHVFSSRKLTRLYGVILIDNEVQAGMARTSGMFTIEHFE